MCTTNYCKPQPNKTSLLWGFIFIFSTGAAPMAVAQTKYMWLNGSKADFSKTIGNVPLPQGYRRTEAAKGSFAEWLRGLPLKTDATVYLYNGAAKGNQQAQHAVLNIDVGSKDLQQCADAVMRLRAEYLYSHGDFKNIHFRFTNGQQAAYNQWKNGFRPVLNAKKTQFSWVKKYGADSSYASFKKYLELIFTYCGTASLQKELKPVQNYGEMAIGDVFIQGGFPGHAVLVVDMAQNANGQKIFLLVQSYMPAQDIHILKNYNEPSIGPWYTVANAGPLLITPEWYFNSGALRRF